MNKEAIIILTNYLETLLSTLLNPIVKVGNFKAEVMYSLTMAV